MVGRHHRHFDAERQPDQAHLGEAAGRVAQHRGVDAEAGQRVGDLGEGHGAADQQHRGAYRRADLAVKAQRIYAELEPWDRGWSRLYETLPATQLDDGVLDAAVELMAAYIVNEILGGGSFASRLYREVRALRIYEGATEVQKLIIARDLLKS